jgi:GH35 family endo-1,4-beta-xylanase
MLAFFAICRTYLAGILDIHFQLLAPATRTNARRSPQLKTAALILLAVSLLTTDRVSSQPLSNSKDRFLGCATNSTPSRFLVRYWNQVTPGNDGKWGSVSLAQGQYNWANLDIIYNFTIQNGLLYKHHALVWGSQQPGWIAALTDRREVPLLDSACDRNSGSGTCQDDISM